MMLSRLWPTCGLAFLTFVTTAAAEVTTLRHYRLGENDPGASDGGATTTIENATGMDPLGVVSGAPTYSAGVVMNGFTATQLCVNFPGDAVATSPVIAGVTDNFGIEVWAKAGVVDGSHCLAYNGRTSLNGWGIYQNGGQFRARFGALQFFGGAPVAAGTWTHLALVRASGTATFYVNGIPTGSITTVPHAPAGFFMTGASAFPVAGEYFNGQLDEVRVFTFEPNRFSRNDLLLPPVPDLAISLEAGNARLSWPATQPNTLLRSTTDLGSGNWAPIPRVYSNGLYEALDPIAGPRRFYQVVDCDPLITQPKLTFKRGTSNPALLPLNTGSSSPVLFRYNQVTLRNNLEIVLDFSDSFKNGVCDPERLSFRWEIEYSNPDYPNPYIHAGITGYDSPTLRIAPNSMLPTSGGTVTLRLVVTRQEGDPSPQWQVVELPATVMDTTLPAP